MHEHVVSDYADGQAGEVVPADTEKRGDPAAEKKSGYAGRDWRERLLVPWIFLSTIVGIVLGNLVDSVGPASPQGSFVDVFVRWIIAPLLMLGLAWGLLPDKQRLQSGSIFVNLARCIAMRLLLVLVKSGLVLIWSRLGSIPWIPYICCGIAVLRYSVRRLAPRVGDTGASAS
ncbi:uncharacterized protein Z518_08998 [Rhinocladiella mackenziei CBS 650.93]|uniref:Uncharacterized protein n=1 Tax=Rhinocladiella mackenziei CBS 650.93 TaxID=1442369 RepID=A0A0D2GSE4_9EURO|nr:uncharacterized protein Z518_08998 [Rhinocladiella mackenziei CBS 650.93]KIX01273.1 hypothetical protein Z518_08998 [Rhinocladiella mackenziei CBS 650.93]